MPLKDVPKAVLDSIKAKFPRAELTEATKETEDGKTTYEIALKDGGRAVELAATADGKITEIETTIDAKALPAQVTTALEAKYPIATIKKAEEIVADQGRQRNQELRGHCANDGREIARSKGLARRKNSEGRTKRGLRRRHQKGKTVQVPPEPPWVARARTTFPVVGEVSQRSWEFASW